MIVALSALLSPVPFQITSFVRLWILYISLSHSLSLPLITIRLCTVLSLTSILWLIVVLSLLPPAPFHIFFIVHPFMDDISSLSTLYSHSLPTLLSLATLSLYLSIYYDTIGMLHTGGGWCRHRHVLTMLMINNMMKNIDHYVPHHLGGEGRGREVLLLLPATTTMIHDGF